MGLMKKLWYLDFSGCPIEATLRSLLGDKAKKTVSVLGYLKSVRDEYVSHCSTKLCVYILCMRYIVKWKCVFVQNECDS